MRVLHVLGGLNMGGAETMVINLYRAIDREQIQFDFVIHNRDQNAYIKEIESLGGKVFVFPKYDGKNTKEYKKHWDSFLKEHKEYHIVHSHVRSYASVFLPVVKKNGRVFIIHSHNTSNGSGMKGIIKTLLQYPLRTKADYLFACSEIAGVWLFGKKAISQNNYYMIKNAIDVERYRFDEEKRERIRKELGLENKTVYGHVGRFNEQKNHMFLLDLFQEIHYRNNNAVLLLIGVGELREQVEERIQAKDLSTSVRLLGARKDVPDLLQAMDVMLFPSLWEGLPVTIVEAQAAGLPCYVSDTVTKEVDLSEAINFIPLSAGVDAWADEVMKAKKRYPEAANNVIKNGFDINTTAKWLMSFYRNIDNE